jgi:maltose/moltooligosaccharide transporter
VIYSFNRNRAFGCPGFIRPFCLTGRTNSGLVIVLSDLYKMPKTMGQLAVVQFFSWFALFSMWIYTTSAVTSHIYGTKDPTSDLYNQGANWVGILFAVTLRVDLVKNYLV